MEPFHPTGKRLERELNGCSCPLAAGNGKPAAPKRPLARKATDRPWIGHACHGRFVYTCRLLPSCQPPPPAAAAAAAPVPSRCWCGCNIWRASSSSSAQLTFCSCRRGQRWMPCRLQGERGQRRWQHGSNSAVMGGCDRVPTLNFH